MKFKLKPLFKDISLIIISEAIVIIAFFLIYRLIAENLGPEGVGEYSLVKRMIGFLLPLLMLGIWVGMPRYIAMSKDKNQRAAYLKAGWLIVISFTFIFLLFVNLFKEYFAKIFFGSLDYTNLIFPSSLFLAGIVLHTFNYAYFRGRLMIKMLNFSQVIILSLIPIGVIVFLKNTTIERLITLIGIITLSTAFIFSLFFIRELFVRVEKKQFKNSLKKLVYYSFPRVPGNFSMAGLLSLGPIFAVHFATIKEVGYLSISQHLLGIVGVIMAPLGIILLPKISNLIIQGRQKIIKENVNFLIAAIFYCFVFLSIQLLIFADVIIKYWLGPEFIPAIPIMRIIFISIIFYAFFVGMGNILEAVKVKPINTINISISLSIFILTAGALLFLFKVFAPIISLSIAFTIGIMCLGVLTYISIRKIYPEKLKKDLNCLFIAILFNILLGAIAILFKPFVISKFYYLIIFEIFLTIIYLSSLWLLKIDWIRQLPKKVIIRN